MGFVPPVASFPLESRHKNSVLREQGANRWTLTAAGCPAWEKMTDRRAQWQLTNVSRKDANVVGRREFENCLPAGLGSFFTVRFNCEAPFKCKITSRAKPRVRNLHLSSASRGLIITVRRTSVDQSAANQLVFMEMWFLSSLPWNVVSNRGQIES